MIAVRQVNWWVIGVLCLCLLAWAVGIMTVTKTARLYEHHSNAGFRRDFFEHARSRWLSVKRVVAPPSAQSGKT